MPAKSLYERIYDVVRRIPEGRVATYGAIAKLLKPAIGARQVGYALHALPEGNDVPWHRVINAQGTISKRGEDCERLQRQLLESEGVQFDRHGRIALDEFQWPDA